MAGRDVVVNETHSKRAVILDVSHDGVPDDVPSVTRLVLGPGLTLLKAEDERLAQAWFERIESAAAVHETPSACMVCRLSPPVVPGNAEPARAWLDSKLRVFPDSDAELADDLVDAFDLAAHIDKPIYMLSRGSARKLALVAAFASGADLTLLETPWAALDGPSSALVTELLEEAADHPSRGWVVHDFTVPTAMASGASRVINLD